MLTDVKINIVVTSFVLVCGKLTLWEMEVIFFSLGIFTYKPDCTVSYLERLQCERHDPLETDGG